MSGWVGLKGFTEPQKKIFKSPARFRVVVAGRRFGKTVLGKNELIYEAQRGSKRLIWYIAPTYKMAKEIMWEQLKDSIPAGMVYSKHETELSIVLRGTKSKIVLKGADNPDSLRGQGLNHVVFDEFADIDEKTWFEAIYPALTDKKGSALFIGTPKGFNWAYDLAMYAAANDNWEYFQYTTADGGNVSKDEIEYAKANLGKKQFNQEFNASFETLANRVYYAFDRNKNTDKGVEDLGGDILIGMDFNVNPMSAVVGERVTNQLHLWDEIVISNGNTEEMCEEIKARYPKRNIYIYPDPSGKSRKTSAKVGVTDFSIIKSYGFHLITPNKAPPIVDRVNEVNAMFENAKGERRVFINPHLTNLMKCLDGLTYKDSTSLPDKKLGLDHLPDALGYLIHMEWPIVSRELKRVKVAGL